MVSRVPRDRQDLQAKLREQIGFLERSSATYDAGDEDEALRLATAIRVLVHDTRRSTSLLSQLDLKRIGFYDSAYNYNPENLLTHHGLIGLQFKDGVSSYRAPLDDRPGGVRRTVSFDDWWNKLVFVDKTGKHTRAGLVLAVANQDGGAHVDPALDEPYVKLSRENSLGWQAVGPAGERPMENPVPASIRQIAHELLRSLREQAPPNNLPDYLSLNPWPGPRRATPKDPVGRNDPCPCGSGKKYKHCHAGPIVVYADEIQVTRNES
ncbi:MAG: SEC-C metal-binding domain-containing protein [Candidatus Binatia bacterium]